MPSIWKKKSGLEGNKKWEELRTAVKAVQTRHAAH